MNAREPVTAGEAIDATHIALRIALHGQNPPIAVQLVHHLIHTLPRDAAQFPGSREFKRAARAHLETIAPGVALDLTRTDVRTGVLWLQRHALLPAWVYPGDRFEGGAADADAR